MLPPEETVAAALAPSETPVSTAAIESTPENPENVSPPLPPSDDGDESADEDEVLGTVEEDTPCFTGPGSQWEILNTLTAGTQVKVFGEGFNVPYYVSLHPDIENETCWLIAGDITLEETDLIFPYIAVPPKPTPQPSNTPDDPRQPNDPTATICVSNQYVDCP